MERIAMGYSSQEGRIQPDANHQRIAAVGKMSPLRKADQVIYLKFDLGKDDTRLDDL